MIKISYQLCVKISDVIGISFSTRCKMMFNHFQSLMLEIKSMKYDNTCVCESPWMSLSGFIFSSSGLGAPPKTEIAHPLQIK